MIGYQIEAADLSMVPKFKFFSGLLKLRNLYLACNIVLIVSGDEFDEEEMLEWITDPNTMAVSDQIEEVNRKMFEKIRSRNDNLVVFFCKLFS